MKENTMEKKYFSTEIAIDLKVDEAIFLHNICYWVELNKRTGNNEVDDKFWTYNSDATFSETIFPYFTPATIRRIRNNLLNKGYIEIGCFNRWSQDKTTWYTYTKKVIEVAGEDYINDIKVGLETIKPWVETN